MPRAWINKENLTSLSILKIRGDPFSLQQWLPLWSDYLASGPRMTFLTSLSSVSIFSTLDRDSSHSTNDKVSPSVLSLFLSQYLSLSLSLSLLSLSPLFLSLSLSLSLCLFLSLSLSLSPSCLTGFHGLVDLRACVQCPLFFCCNTESPSKAPVDGSSQFRSNRP